MIEDGQESDLRRRTRGCAVLLIVFFLLPFAALKACGQADAHPTDIQMKREFQQERVVFAKLLEMVRQEKRVTRVAHDFIWIDGMMNVPENERRVYLSDERWAAYKKLFDLLKLESGVVRYKNGDVGLFRSSSGMVTSGSSKEYLWSPKFNGSALSASDQRSLEDACTPKTGCSSARRIASGWYITFESH